MMIYAKHMRPLFTLPMICGLIFTAALAVISFYLAKAPLFVHWGLGALTLAILIGIIIGNSFFGKIAPQTGPGIDFAKNKLLRLGIILYGFGITLQEIGGVGGRGILIDAIVVAAVFFLGIWLGQKIFKLDRDTGILISAGSAICGAAAVMAAEPVLKAQAHKVSIAVATVVIFGTVSMFLYPLLYPYMGLDQHQFGIYIGSTIHEVAQVVAAGKAVGEQTTADAVIVKMIRVMLLVPFLLLLSAYISRRSGTAHVHGGAAQTGLAEKPKILIPWFAVLFVVASLIASTSLLPPALIGGLKTAGTLLLAMAMAALGLRTHYSAFRQAGLKPLALAFCLFLFLLIGGAALNLLVLKI